MRFKIGIVIFSSIFICGFAVYQYFLLNDGKLTVVFCDVGQGDAIYIRTPNGTDIVIDAGRTDAVLTCLSNHMPFWDKTIELAFATHPDADHIGGFSYVLESYAVKQYNTVEVEKNTGVFLKINNLLQEQGISPRHLKLGDTFLISDGVVITTHWPTKEFIEKGDSDTNRYSLVQTVTYKDFDMLLTGDIDFDILNSIFNSGFSVDVFKLAHHGSRTGVDRETFTLIKPLLSIISAGKNNSYGHPHKEVTEVLQKFNIKYLRTDEIGEIEITSTGDKYKIQ